MNKINEFLKQDIRDFIENDDVSKVCPVKNDCITNYKIKK